jgi:transcriptional regulator with XRE-family HTH domain
VWRAERNLTQVLLARKTRINQTRISFFENGLAEPSSEERDRLARALKTTIQELFPEAAA